MSENLIEVRDLRKSFSVPNAGKKKLRALDGITLDLPRGETLGLVGESGCGKSTLARTLLMLERPESGTVRFDGIDVMAHEFPLPDYRISIVHGKLTAAEKQFEMNRFIKGETQIMVATTVIEVGVNIPNASVMIIENAERFGLSQLHQLRGRVGRGAVDREDDEDRAPSQDGASHLVPWNARQSAKLPEAGGRFGDWPRYPEPSITSANA